MATEPIKTKKEKKYFFRDLKTELKKVIWPTPKQLINNTIAVVSIVIIVAAVVCVLDFAFDKMSTHGIDGIKHIIRNNVDTVNEDSLTGDPLTEEGTTEENIENDTIDNETIE